MKHEKLDLYIRALETRKEGYSTKAYRTMMIHFISARIHKVWKKKYFRASTGNRI
jgi:hypothetical protein